MGRCLVNITQSSAVLPILTLGIVQPSWPYLPLPSQGSNAAGLWRPRLLDLLKVGLGLALPNGPQLASLEPGSDGRTQASF